MTIPSWAEQYCSQNGELMLLYDPENGYVCKSNGLKIDLSRRNLSMTEFLRSLKPSQYMTPDFSEFSLHLDKVSIVDNIYCYEFSHFHIESEQSWQMFANTMSKLHEVMLRLSQVETLDELYKQSIVEAQRHLFIDRLAILLLDSNTNEMVGTWGTDEDGNIKDETSFRGPIPNSPWVEHTLANQDHVEVWDNVDLLYYNKVVGKGWNAMAAMWDGEKAIGWITCDNLIHKRPMQPWLKEIIGQYGQALGHAIVRFNNLAKLKSINDNLERLVSERSAQLSEQVSLLEQAQEELVESEKLASLGGLVAGVSHEVNTPIGIGVTASSHLVHQTKHLKTLYDSQKIKKSDLDSYIECALESGEIIQDNLMRASELIKSFKQLAVDQSFESIMFVNIKDLVDNIGASFNHKIKKKPIQYINHIDAHLACKICSGKLNQILTNLVSNTLLHAFENTSKGTIEINANIEGDSLYIQYFDSGAGVSDETLSKLFEPFFTTKRGQGGTGLGLNIIYNILKKMGGKIEATHREPSGLKFDIQLPIEVNDD
jgi:signal transduction histidine kinase